MRILEQHELRQRGSRYFPPGRTHPFLVRLLQAIMSLKRLAKRLKNSVVMLRSVKVRKGDSYLYAQIRKLNRVRHMAQYGSRVVTECDIRAPVREVVEYRNKKTGKLYEDEEEAMKASVRAAKVARLPKYRTRAAKFHKHFQRHVNEHVDQYNKSLASKDLGSDARLLKKLTKAQDTSTAQLEGADRMYRRGGLQVGAPASRPSTAPAGPSPAQTEDVETHDEPTPVTAAALIGHEEEVVERAVEYPKHTGIYYGSAVSFQAKHGGFLSFKAQHISTAAFRITSTTKFIVIKAGDVINRGAVCYGDAVWLCIGDLSASSTNCFVVGAAFDGKVQRGTDSRQLTPQLVNHGVENRYKSSQYGRWIVINKNEPVGANGKPVGHLEELLLEQEWSFLASNQPGQCSVHKLEADIDDIMNQTLKVDLLRPGDECCWRVHIAGFSSGTMASASENKRAAMIDKATTQMKDSKAGRIEFLKTGIMIPLANRLDPRLSSDALKEGWANLPTPLDSKKHPQRPLTAYSKQGWTGDLGPLHFKQSQFLNQKHLIHLYSEQAANAFSRQPSIDFIKNLYGKHSLIYKKKKEVLNIRATQTGIVKPPTRTVEIADQTALNEYLDDYWQASQSLMVPTEVWAQLSVSMRQYYKMDLVKKIEAVVTIQRAVRRWLSTRFHFGRKFSALDKAAAVQWHRYFVNRRRRLMFAGDEDDERGAPSKRSGTRSTLLSQTSASATFLTSGSEGGGGGGGGGDGEHPTNPESYATIDAEKRATDATKQLPRRQPRASQSMYGNLDAVKATAMAAGLMGALPPSPESLTKAHNAEVGGTAAKFPASRAGNRHGSMPNIAMPLKASSAPLLLLSSPVAATKPSSALSTAAPKPAAEPTPPVLTPAQIQAAKKQAEREAAKKQLAAKLAKSDHRDFGLPLDCFEGLQQGVSISSGVKFLRTVSSAGALYADIQSKKKRGGGGGGGGGGGQRPQTAI